MQRKSGRFVRPDFLLPDDYLTGYLNYDTESRHA